MRPILAVLLLASLSALFASAALLKGNLEFSEAKKLDEFSSLASDGYVMVYFWQPPCKGCKYLETYVFTDPRVVERLQGWRLIAIDVSSDTELVSVPVILWRKVLVMGPDGYAFVDGGGKQTLFVQGTPTILIGEGTPEGFVLRGYLFGAVPSDEFLRFIDMSFQAGDEGTGLPPVFMALPIAFALGSISILSPCVFPVLAIGSAATFARRRLGLVLLGLVAAFSTVGIIAAFLGQFLANLRPVLFGVAGAVSVALSLMILVERLNRAFMEKVSALQSAAFRTANRASDMVLGMSLGAVWVPCMAPFVGLVSVSALLSGDFAVAFGTYLAYGLGLAVTLYVLLKLIRRIKHVSGMGALGRRLELAAGITLIAIGVMLLGEAAGLGLWSAFLGLLGVSLAG